MYNVTRIAITLAISLGFSGCGGSQNDIPLDYDIPFKTPSTITGYPLDQTYWNNYVIPAAAGSLQFRESQRYGQQWATSFSYARSMWIHRITWLGLIENNDSLLDGTTHFVLRLSEGDVKNQEHVPSALPMTEYLVEAEARFIDTLESGYLYEFAYIDYLTFQVPAGIFWISVVDPGIEGINFSWALATDTSFSSGARASLRTTDNGEWQAKIDSAEFEPMAIRLDGGRLIENP